MKKLIAFFLAFTSIPLLVLAQKEANNWFFGYNCGLNFNSSVPAFVPGGSTHSNEGCSSISDAQGNLLFYTDGMTVWNRNNAPMPSGTGLAGDSAATQSAIITAYPGSDSLYYIFTVDTLATDDLHSAGLQYSIVNMTQNGGLGDVVQKNIPILNPTCEKAAAVKHKNGNDIWLVTHGYGNNEFYVYLIDCKGINLEPQVYSLGNTISQVQNAAGYLRFSPDNKRLAAASFGASVEVFDFDDVTGSISNEVLISSSPNNGLGPYGVEFSPDSKLLYVSEVYNADGSGNFNLFQYNLSAPDILSSRITLESGNNGPAGALQRGPDNRIYVAYDQMKYIGAITSPDTYGTGCNLVREFIPTSGAATCGAGLPNIMAGYDKTILGRDTILCDGATYAIGSDLPNTTFKWEDGSTGNFIDVTRSKNYAVEISSDGCTYKDTVNVTFKSTVATLLGADTILCNGTPLLLKVDTIADSYLWQDNSTQAVFTVMDSGIYYVTIRKNDCIMSDTIAVNYLAVPAPSLGSGRGICPGQTILLNPSSEGTSYVWQDGSTNSTFEVSGPGRYRVTVGNECGSSDAEVEITSGSCRLMLPNAFTPGKSTNSLFKITNGYLLKDFRLQVFNRWGQPVYNSTDPSSGWNGMFRGVAQPGGVYVYYIRYMDPSTSRMVTGKGTVMLIR